MVECSQAILESGNLSAEMKVLITGGAGFVGSSLASYFRLTKPDWQITAFDNLRRRGSELNLKSFGQLGIRFLHGDIRSTSDLSDIREDFDLFIEASAEPSVLAGTAGSPDYVVQANLMGTFNCLNFARAHAQAFLFLSTSRVYSIDPLRRIRLKESGTRFEIAPVQEQVGISSNGISEAFPTDTARSFYGTTKLSSEYLVQEFVHSYGLRAVSYRCGVIAGPGQFGKVDQGVFTVWLANHYFGRPLQYTGFGGTGRQVRDLLHPLDLADLILKHLPTFGQDSGDVFNVGGGPDRSVSLVELTRICEDLTGNHVDITGRETTSPVDVPLFISDCSKIRQRLNWEPSRSTARIFEDTLNWIRDNESLLRYVFI
jgi:CDP-paratose 2-epimerase